MKEENVEELNSMELMKLIFEEVKNIKKELNEKIDIKFNYLEEKIDSIYKELNNKIDNIYKELKDKMDNKFNYLDKKIDNTKNTLVKEISEELKTFYQMNQDSTNNLNKKIDGEIEDRKVDVSKIKEFNRIIINDIRSRVSILEEENEKYDLN